MIKQLTELLKQISIQDIETKPILKPELDKVMVIKQVLQGQNIDQVGDQNELVPLDFINYILQEGTKEQKRELISCLNRTIYLENKQVLIK